MRPSNPFSLLTSMLIFASCMGQMAARTPNPINPQANWLHPWAVNAGQDVSICLGSSTQLLATGANSYSWSPAAGLSCTNCPNPIASPTVSTTYTVLGSDGTMDDVVVKVLSPPVILNVHINHPSDCNLPNGSIVITTLGTDPYEYSIDGGTVWQNNGVFTALPPGSYSVRVRSNNGICVINGGNFALVEPPSPHILNILDSDPSFCDVPNGSITISATGGLNPLQYSIDNGQTWQAQNSFQLLGSGNYQIRVRNSNGSCEISGGTVTLTGSPDEAIISDIFIANPTNCDETDGLITIIVPNSGGQFEFSINGGINYQSNNSFSGLDEGIYHVIVRRTDGTCTNSGGFVELVSPNRPTMYGISAVNPQGCGAQTGNITILAFGPSTLQFSIDGGITWHSSNIFPNLPVSTYEVAVRNSDGSCFTEGATVTLTEPGPPVINTVTPTNPTACGLADGSIQISATGTGLLEYSINGGVSWHSSSNFNNLPNGSYPVQVRYVGGGCPVAYASNPVVLSTPGTVPHISAINITQPSICGLANGTISILASGSGPLSYSINGGISFQPGNIFNNLAAGNYPIVVAITGGNCTSTGNANLFYSGCTDTIQVTIPGNTNTNYCIDPSNFNNLGNISSASFCNQGSPLTVAATSLNQNCLNLSPATGFSGLSPDLICTVHCFNNTNICDTTYLQVSVQNTVNCDPIFSNDTVLVAYTGNPTSYCVPVPLTDLLGFQLYLNGTPLNNPLACDYEPTTAYSYTFLPGAGFSGPYFLNTWTVNGNSFSGNFANANQLLALMIGFDPTGNWQIDMVTGLIYGGNSNSNYGDMDVTHIPSGTKTILTINTTFLPTGFTVGLSDPGISSLVVQNPVTGCADTLYINALLDPTVTDTVFLTTTVNTPTVSTCLSGSELPGGVIINVGYCLGPDNGGAPLSSPTCVYYVPNLNFAGQDEFCMVVCDGGFPQVCDTTYFIVNVLPQNDTIYLTIPAGETSIDTCLNNFVIELPGSISSASFCSINTTEISGTVNGNCLLFNSNGNFFGTTTACVSFCSGSFCDVNTVIVTIEPPIVCEEIFSQDSLNVTTPISDNSLCIPIPTSEIVSYLVTIDGAPYTQSFTPCGFGNLSVYSYANLPAGPYTVNSWTANGTNFSGVVSNLAALVAQMNTWDPNGDWAINSFTQTIQGGQGGTYSNIVITPIGGPAQTLTMNLVQFPLGSQIAISGYGNHLVTVTAANGCSDTVIVNFEQHVYSTETLEFNTSPNTTIDQICGNTSELLGNLFSVSFCDLPNNGGFVPTTATCFSYTPNLGFIGSDTVCVVFCDDNFIPVCDTFLFVIHVQPLTDTLFVTAPNNSPFDTCLSSTILQLPGILVNSSLCGANNAEVTLTLSANCVTIDVANNFTGTTTACVVHCDDSVPAICDTTYLVITLPNAPPPCPEIFNPDEVFLSLQNGAGEACLPISPQNIVDYNIIVDGQAYTGGLIPCDVDQVYIYFYGQVFGQGANGPYSVSWTINGQNFAGMVQNMQALVAQMNIWDNAGNWTIEPSTFSIISTNNNGVYGNLIITHIATGILSTIAPDLNGVPFGTAIQINGAGQHEIIVESQVDGCSDTLSLIGLNGVNQLDIFTYEDEPSNVECIDITGLPGTFSSLTVCQAPTDGTISITGNCFTFNPNPGFVGSNSGCVVACDNLGNCDTTLLNITVDPLCSLYDFFPDSVVHFQVQDCADVAAFCTAILLDSINSFGVLDNGFPYSQGFVPCNGQFTQIALDTGLHEIVFLHLNTGCQDTLFADVSCTANNGCGTTALSALSIAVGDCSETTQFCVSISVADLPNFLISDNGTSFAGTVSPCNLNGTTVGLTLDTGLHILILADTVKGCADTFNVEVLCTIIEDVSIDSTINQGDTIILCLEDYGYLPVDIDSVTVGCTLDSIFTTILDTNTWCITIIGDSIGVDSACFTVFVGGTSAVFTANITVLSPCPVFIPGGVLATGVPCTVDTGLVCLPLNFGDLINKTLKLDGLPYTGQLVACGFDSLFVLNYSSLPSTGLIGPYIIESWTVNGTVHTGVFNSIQELADSMNLWDPTGDWEVVYDPINNLNLIEGGDPLNTYSGMAVKQEVSGIQVVLGLNIISVPTGVAIQLPLGAFDLTITDTITHCSETALIELTCVNSDIVTDTILVFTQDTFCLDLSELVGNVISIINICPGSNGETATFAIDSTCVIYTGNEPGFDSACVVVCDDAGLCDTTYFYITVDIANDSLPIAVDDLGLITEQDIVYNVPVLNNDTVQFLLDVYIIVPPAHGTAQPLPNGTINYVPDPGYCDEAVPDTFTYSICNPIGCDTATVSITVLCSGLEVFQAFSPNGDGKNESFVIKGLQDYPNHHLTIFNRWGVKVYESTNYLSNWEGTYKDKKLPDGTYFYVLDLGDGGDVKTGYVVILR